MTFRGGPGGARALALRAPFVVAAASWAVVPGCADGARAEADAVRRAIDVARDAPNEAKREPAERLARTPCSAADVCLARDVCADALRHLASGVETGRSVRSAVAADGGSLDDGRRRALEADLDRADAELAAARAGWGSCEAAVAAMRRAHRI